VTFPGGEIGKRHFEGAANLRLQSIHLAGESVWRQPFCRGVGVEEGAIDALRGRAKYSMELNGVGLRSSHALILFS
jgi:hypothetical protein